MKSPFSVVRRSFAALLPLAAVACLLAQEPRLANVSTLSRVGTGADVLTAGFFIGGTAPKQVVIRAVSARLATAPFNVEGTLANPTLTVYGPNSSTTIAASNDNWTAADAAAIAAVGAFPLTPGSNDAAVVATLAPGTYTAQVSGVGGATGNALVEVYEVGTGSGRFLNLSARARVGGTGGTLTPGFVITPGGGTRKLLIRAAGPGLAPLGVTGFLANPSLSLTRTGTGGGLVATNDNWSTPIGTAATTAVLDAAFRQAGAFPFPANSADAALLLDLPPGDYTVEVTGAANTTGIAVVELYDLSPANPVFVSVTATKPQADETGSRNGEFTFTRTGPLQEPLTVRFAVGGSAVNGTDYLTLAGIAVIPAGEASVRVPLQPNPDLTKEGTDTVTITVLSTPAYYLGPQPSATATIADSTATLYVANIRPDSGATGSTASGTATILLSADGTLAAVTLSVSNLSSAVTSAHLRIGPSGDFVFNLPYSASGTSHWTFAPVGNYSSAALIDALKNGNIYLSVDTAKYPTGEVRGTFVPGSGSRNFSAPPPPPAVALDNLSAIAAARLLTQATFGPKRSEIDALTGGRADAWISSQLALPFTSHRAEVLEDRRTFGGSPSVTNFNAIHPPNRQAAWWKIVLTAPDQLRQRVAFALSQILVVSDVSLGDDNRTEPLAHYYDLLGEGAFGNFRTLLENVTLSPMMGEYLSHLRNARANPVTGSTPDENYAREIMQLFTIGLVQLHPDGTLILGEDGLPIPTYHQGTITELAKVFTGWAYPSTNANAFRTAARDFIRPMQLYPNEHDNTAKDLTPVIGTPLPANQGGVADLRTVLDALVDHQNTAPFISRRLIQRLVTSNPSPAYVYRVAQAFRRERTSPTQMAEVVRAILTDFEARSPEVAANISFGKLKEPLLRISAVLRGFDARAATGRFSGHLVTMNGVPITSASTYNSTMPAPVTVIGGTNLRDPQGSTAQAALRSPTVFNFFSPEYVLPGPLAAAGLVVPEFEITDDTYATNVPNYLRSFVFASNVPPANPTPLQTQQAATTLMPDYTFEQSLLGDLPALVDHLNLVLAAGNVSPAARTRIVTALAALPANALPLDRVRTAVLLVVMAPGGALQR